MTGSAFDNITATENSRPLIYSSRMTSSSRRNASLSAVSYYCGVCMMDIPTLEPPQHGFTMHGSDNLVSLKFLMRSVFFMEMPCGVGMSCFVKKCLLSLLFIAMALLK